MDGPWDKYASSTMTNPDVSNTTVQPTSEDDNGPWSKYASSTETAPTPIPPSIPDASGALDTSVGAVASGLMKGSESMLETAQGASNIIGGAIGVPSSQDFGNTAQQMEKDRQQFLGNQKSLHGKVLENIAQLPALVAMIGSPEGAGLLGAKGGLEAFAGQGALQQQSQSQNQGKSVKEQIRDMAWAATKQAAFGAVIGKAIKMGNVSGPALAAAYTAGVTGLQGGDPNDILAGAITGAGMTTLSNPKILASVLSSGAEAVGSAQKGFNNLAESLKTKGPLTATADILGAKADNYYAQIHDMVNAPDKIAEIDQKIGQTNSEQQETQKNLIENAQLLKSQNDQEKINVDNETKGALTSLEQQKSVMESNVSSILAQKGIEISSAIDGASKELAGNIDNTVDGIKGGKLKVFFNNISTAFTGARDAMEKLFSASNKPLTRADGIDAATSALEQIADANGNIDGTSPTAQALNKMITFLKESPLKGTDDTSAAIVKLRKMGVPEESIARYRAKNSSIDLSEEVPLKTIKGLFDRAKNADPYGSHEGDIANKSFAALMEKKLADNGQDTTQFKKIMSDMSDAISYKTKLSRIFQLKEGTAYNESGFKFLKEIATGKDENGKIVNPSSSRLLDVLQNGLSIGGIKAEGIGDVSTSLKQMGMNLDKLEGQYKNIGYKEKSTIANVGKNFVERMAKAKADGKLTKDRLDLEHERVMANLTQLKNQLKVNTEEQLKKYAGDRSKQEEILQRKKDIASVIGVMGLTVSVYASKIGYAFRAVSKLTARNATGLGKRP